MLLSEDSKEHPVRKDEESLEEPKREVISTIEEKNELGKPSFLIKQDD